MLRLISLLLIVSSVVFAQGSHTYEVYYSGSTPGAYRFREAYGLGGHFLEIAGPQIDVASSYRAYWEVTANCNSLANGGKLTVNGSDKIVCADDNGGAGGGVAGSEGEVQLNLSGVHGVRAGFLHDDEALFLPPSGASPTTEGGQLTLKGDTTTSMDFSLDVSQGSARMFATSGSDLTFQFLNAGAGALNLSVDGAITPLTDGVFSLGTAGATDKRWSVGAFDDVRTEDLLFQRQGQSSHDFGLSVTGTGVLSLTDSFGSGVVTFDESLNRITFHDSGLILGVSGGHPQIFANSASDRTLTMFNAGAGDLDIVFEGDLTPSGSTRAVGSAISPWNTMDANTVAVHTAIVPDSIFGANFGSISLPFDNGWIDSLQVVTNLSPGSSGVSKLGGAVGTGSGTASWDAILDNVTLNTDMLPDTNGGAILGGASLRFSIAYLQNLDVDTSATIRINTGNFYGKMQAANSTSLSCAGLNGWQGVTLDNYLVVCRDTGTPTRYRVALTVY